MLTCVVVILWVIAIALPTWVLVTIALLPGEDPGRTARSLVIASGAFLSIAIPAVGASVGLVAFRRHLRSGRRSVSSGDPSERHNPLAIAGFVLAFGATLVGLVLSIVALVQIRRSGERGQGLAVAGIAISAGAMVIGTVILIVQARLGVGVFAPGMWT